MSAMQNPTLMKSLLGESSLDMKPTMLGRLQETTLVVREQQDVRKKMRCPEKSPTGLLTHFSSIHDRRSSRRRNQSTFFFRSLETSIRSTFGFVNEAGEVCFFYFWPSSSFTRSVTEIEATSADLTPISLATLTFVFEPLGQRGHSEAICRRRAIALICMGRDSK